MSADCNISDFLKRLQQIDAKVRETARKGLQDGGLHILGQAQKLAPVDTGALKASGTFTPATIEGSSISMTIGFNTEYAAAVHERLDLHHKQGQAKFLDTAVRQGQEELNERVIARIKAAQGRT